MIGNDGILVDRFCVVCPEKADGGGRAATADLRDSYLLILVLYFLCRSGEGLCRCFSHEAPQKKCFCVSKERRSNPICLRDICSREECRLARENVSAEKINERARMFSVST